MSRNWLVFSTLSAFALLFTGAVCAEEEGFKTIFDGKNMEGWKINENKDSWKLEEGALVAKGPRSHIFYVGDKEPFTNFEFKIDVQTKKGSNGGVYFHTQYQETGWPKFGFESQVNQTHGDPIKSGSLYQVQNVSVAAAKDDEWYTQHIIVNGKHVTVKINDKTVVDYTEPEGKEAGKDFTRKLDKGTFALQAHDPNSVVMFKNIRVKRLP